VGCGSGGNSAFAAGGSEEARERERETREFSPPVIETGLGAHGRGPARSATCRAAGTRMQAMPRTCGGVAVATRPAEGGPDLKRSGEHNQSGLHRPALPLPARRKTPLCVGGGGAWSGRVTCDLKRRRLRENERAKGGELSAHSPASQLGSRDVGTPRVCGGRLLVIG